MIAQLESHFYWIHLKQQKKISVFLFAPRKMHTSLSMSEHSLNICLFFYSRLNLFKIVNCNNRRDISFFKVILMRLLLVFFSILLTLVARQLKSVWKLARMSALCRLCRGVIGNSTQKKRQIHSNSIHCNQGINSNFSCSLL